MTQIIVAENVPLETYLANPRLSTHLMSTFCDLGPRMFIMRSGKMIADKPQSDEQRIGQLFEDMVQGRAPDLSIYAVRPKGMKFNEGSAKDPTTGKGWKAAQDAAGKIIIDQDDLDAMQWMQDSFWENESAVHIVKQCKKQVTMYQNAGMFGLKSRPDYMIPGELSVDLKTCSNLNQLTSGKQVREYRYYCQAALVARLMREDIEPRFATKHYLLGVEKQTPYRCQLIEVGGDWLDAGSDWIDEQVARIERCARADSWPRVEQETVSLPPVPSWL